MSQAVGLLCALLYDSEPVVLDFPGPPAVSSHRQLEPPCHHSITSCSAAHLTMGLSAKCPLLPDTDNQSLSEENPALKVSLIISVFVFLMNQKTTRKINTKAEQNLYFIKQCLCQKSRVDIEKKKPTKPKTELSTARPIL